MSFWSSQAVASGVFQESMIVLQLFTIYINDAAERAKSSISKFADDSKKYLGKPVMMKVQRVFKLSE